MMIGNVREVACAPTMMAGALSTATGLDRILVARGIPQFAHWALAGVAIDAFCKGKLIPSFDQQILMSAGMGAAGGYLTRNFIMK